MLEAAGALENGYHGSSRKLLRSTTLRLVLRLLRPVSLAALNVPERTCHAKNKLPGWDTTKLAPQPVVSHDYEANHRVCTDYGTQHQELRRYNHHCRELVYLIPEQIYTGIKTNYGQQ